MSLSLKARDKVPFLGLQFDSLQESDAIRAVRALAQRRAFSYIVTPNVDHIVRLHRQPPDQRLWSAYRDAEHCLCDSRILGWLARCSGLALTVVPGSDLTAKLLADESNWATIAVVGGDDVLMHNLREQHPRLKWVHHAPPYGVIHNLEAQQKIIEFVEKCSAELYFIAIGSPQSELICAALCQRQKATGVGLCIGASLEFLTEVKVRAPRWIQRAGAEWLFRLASEPARLWRRYLLEGPAIFRIWWRWHVNSSRSRAASGSTPSAGPR